MDCERDSHNPSLKDASSLSQLVDSVVAEVHQLNEPISGVSESDYDYEPHTLLSPALVQAFDPNSCKSNGTGMSLFQISFLILVLKFQNVFSFCSNLRFL